MRKLGLMAVAMAESSKKSTQTKTGELRLLVIEDREAGAFNESA